MNSLSEQNVKKQSSHPNINKKNKKVIPTKVSWSTMCSPTCWNPTHSQASALAALLQPHYGWVQCGLTVTISFSLALSTFWYLNPLLSYRPLCLPRVFLTSQVLPLNPLSSQQPKVSPARTNAQSWRLLGWICKEQTHLTGSDPVSQSQLATSYCQQLDDQRVFHQKTAWTSDLVTHMSVQSVQDGSWFNTRWLWHFKKMI